MIPGTVDQRTGNVPLRLDGEGADGPEEVGEPVELAPGARREPDQLLELEPQLRVGAAALRSGSWSAPESASGTS